MVCGNGECAVGMFARRIMLRQRSDAGALQLCVFPVEPRDPPGSNVDEGPEGCAPHGWIVKRCDDENYVLTAVVAPRGDMLTNSILRAARWQSKCAAEVRAAAMTDRSVGWWPD